MSTADCIANGELVYQHDWLGARAIVGQIRRLADGYYAIITADDSDDACYGPYPRLVDALPLFNNNAVTPDTSRLWCRELSDEQLIPMLNLHVCQHPGFTINDNHYQVANNQLAAAQ